MKKTVLNLLLFIISSSVTAQGIWQVSALADMPEPVSNNAIATDGTHVFSFMGIDSTKLYSGIHLKGFRYNISTNVWDTIPDVPDSISRIAGSASEVNGKIYVIGGYHVLSNGGEISSNKVFIYNPSTNTYTNGASIPIATDDHVQCVWQDSLIYVISGWSNDSNIVRVQIYNPALDTWSAGTSLPAGSDYEAFGASGVIINNTIYYAGGVNDTWVFSILPKIRTGVVDPANPTNITWSTADDSSTALYRSVAGILDGKPVWFGGADKAYNYNGIEYGTGVGIEPLNNVTTYNPMSSTFSVDSGSAPSIMDMRGIAQIDTYKFIIAGGMGPAQQVSAKTYLLEFIPPSGIYKYQKQNSLIIFPNPASTLLWFEHSKNLKIESWSIRDITGRIVSLGTNMTENPVPVSQLQNGLYNLQVRTKGEILSTSFLVNR